MSRSESKILSRRATALGEARRALSPAAREGRALSSIEREHFNRAIAEDTRLSEMLEFGAGGSEYRNAVIPEPAIYRDSAARDEFTDWLLGRGEQRDLSESAATNGGFLSGPARLSAQVLTLLDETLAIRQVATVLPPIDQSAGTSVPIVVTNPGDANWTAETSEVSFDTDMTVGSRQLLPHPLTRGIKVSRKLLRVGGAGIESVIVARLAARLAAPLERGYVAGSGAGQPLGVFTASPQGIPTSRDISTGNGTTSVSWDGLSNAFFSLRAVYQSRATWIMHSDVLRQISQLKDSAGQPHFDFSERPDEPNVLFGRPIVLSEFAPNVFTSGSYLAVVGDFSRYVIQDGTIEIQKLLEKFALTSQVGFIGRMFSDGGPAIPEAFSRVQLA